MIAMCYMLYWMCLPTTVGDTLLLYPTVSNTTPIFVF